MGHQASNPCKQWAIGGASHSLAQPGAFKVVAAPLSTPIGFGFGWLENAAPKDGPSGTQMDPVLLLVLFLHLLPEIWHLGRSTAPLRNLTL